MTFFRRYTLAFSLMSFAAAGVALYLGVSGQLATSETPPLDIPLLWCWDNITVHAGFNRWFDPIWAMLWVLIPIYALKTRIKYDDLHLAPLYGLAAAGGFYLVFWGEPGVAFWPLTAPVALVIARICNLLNAKQAQADGYRLTGRFNFSHILGFSFNFGIGLLLPMALLYGFVPAAITWWIFGLLCITLSLVVFIPLWLGRLGIWLYRKIRPTAST